MDEMVYLAMTGAKADGVRANDQQPTILQTYLPPASGLTCIPSVRFRSMVRAIDSRINAVVESYGTDFSQGAVVSTGRDLDVAIQGSGFLARCKSPDGT